VGFYEAIEEKLLKKIPKTMAQGKVIKFDPLSYTVDIAYNNPGGTGIIQASKVPWPYSIGFLPSNPEEGMIVNIAFVGNTDNVQIISAVVKPKDHGRNIKGFTEQIGKFRSSSIVDRIKGGKL
jgi:hypothetical protein